MQASYSDSAQFNDPVFTGLNAAEVKAMWQMLLQNGKDLSLEYNDVKANDKTGSARWVATYTFSKTGRKVVNVIQADFNFEEGKIIRHNDHFSFYRWASQALGLSGILLGWTPFMKRKVQATAKQNLQAFIAKKRL